MLKAVKGVWKVVRSAAAGIGLALAMVGCSSVFPAPATTHAVDDEPLVRRTMAGRLPAARDESNRVVVWIVSDFYHTGIVLPLDWLEENGFRTPPGVRGARWINASWGDRVAYEQERWLNPVEVANALIAPSDSVLEMIRVDYDPRWVFPEQRVYRGTVDRARGRQVAEFFNYCAVPASDGSDWTLIGDPTWGQGGLYACPHSYGFPRLCNSWTAGALEACGYSLDLRGRLLANALIRQCLRQGFERVPPLSRDERELLAAYLKRTGHVLE